MVERELPKLNTRVRFPSPARSSRATARRSPQLAKHIWSTQTQRAKASRRSPAAAGRRRTSAMHYVYILESIATPGHYYIGYTAQLRDRIKKHQADVSSHAAKFRLGNSSSILPSNRKKALWLLSNISSPARAELSVNAISPNGSPMCSVSFSNSGFARDSKSTIDENAQNLSRSVMAFSAVSLRRPSPANRTSTPAVLLLKRLMSASKIRASLKPFSTSKSFFPLGENDRRGARARRRARLLRHSLVRRRSDREPFG